MKKYKDLIIDLIKKTKNNPKLLIVIGIVGVSMIFISSIFDNSGKKEISTTKLTAYEYCNTLEVQLSKQIKEVVGGNVEVMITLESGVEYIYASEAKNNESEIEDSDNKNSQKLQKDKESQNNFILYKDENGNEVPLVVTEIMPSVKGVVVGCDNGDNEYVCTTIKNLVTTALDVSDDKVCVVGLNIYNWERYNYEWE